MARWVKRRLGYDKYLTGVQLSWYLWGIPGFDRVKSLAEKLSANACSLTYHVTGLEPKTQQGEYRVAEEVWDSKSTILTKRMEEIQRRTSLAPLASPCCAEANITRVARNLAFARKTKGAISGHFLLIFQCLGKILGRKKTRAQPWYARTSGKSLGRVVRLSNRDGNRRAFRLPGRAGSVAIVQWNLFFLPGHIRCSIGCQVLCLEKLGLITMLHVVCIYH